MLSQNNSSNFRLTDATGTSFKLALQKCLWAMTQQNNKQKIKRSLCNLRVHSHYFPASENLSLNPSESKVCNGTLLSKCRCFFDIFGALFLRLCLSVRIFYKLRPFHIRECNLRDLQQTILRASYQIASQFNDSCNFWSRMRKLACLESRDIAESSNDQLADSK